MKTTLLIALLVLSCGDEITKDPYVEPEEPYQATARECRVCMNEDGYHVPPIRSDCGPGANKNCVHWCVDNNCRRYARSGPGVQ